MDTRGMIAAVELARRGHRKIILCHGCFDLLHLGHVNYIKQAQSLGGFVFISVTSDRFVNKGPDRPIFTAEQRVAMLDSLTGIAGIAINDAPDCCELISAIKPDYYVKGEEYSVDAEDLFTAMGKERFAVEANGGKVYFTKGQTFSSSSLINRYFDIDEPQVREYLNNVTKRGYAEKLPEMIEKIAKLKVLMIGETIIDEYRYVSPMGKPPKEAVLAVRAESQESFFGGIQAAAAHLASFCSLETITQSWPLKKTRFVEQGNTRKLFEVFEDSEPTEIIPAMDDLVEWCDLVVVNDFGHGFLTPELRSRLTHCGKYLAVNAQSNSANHGFNPVTKYPRANYVCVDAPEARLAVGDQDASVADIAGRLIHAKMQIGSLSITMGRDGAVTYNRVQGVRRVPSFARKVVDTMGAGDAYFAVTSPLSMVTDDMEAVGFIGNVVGALKVGNVGHRRPVDKAQVLGYIKSLLK